MNESVEMMPLESVLDDAAQAPENTGTLDEVANEVPTSEPEEATEAVPAKEPGWIKQRVNKAVDKAVREAESRVRAEYEALLAPIREDVMDRQARELVQSGEFKSIDIAKEYVRLKAGAPIPAAEPEPQAQARDSQGRFVAQNDNRQDPASAMRAEMLASQAHKIKKNRGLDVMEVFNNDPDIQQRVLSGELDFYDVADSMAGNHGRNAPAPMRSPNAGSSSGGISIANMTDAQFKKLQENLSNGRRYDVSK